MNIILNYAQKKYAALDILNKKDKVLKARNKNLNLKSLHYKKVSFNLCQDFN